MNLSRRRLIGGSAALAAFAALPRAEAVAAARLAVLGHKPITSLTPSGPITTSQNGQVLSGLDITATGTPGLTVSHSGVQLFNCRIRHSGGPGVYCVGKDYFHAENVITENIGKTSGQVPGSDPSFYAFHIENSLNPIVKRVRMTGASAGIYSRSAPNGVFDYIEGYNFCGPGPAGQMVAIAFSNNSKLTNFYCENDPQNSWPEDSINIFASSNCYIGQGYLKGANSPTGAHIQIDMDVPTLSRSNNCVIEDVYSSGAFESAFSTTSMNTVWRRCFARDNIYANLGRGVPSSQPHNYFFQALYYGPYLSAGNQILQCGYYNPAIPSDIVFGPSGFTTVDLTSANFTTPARLQQRWPWE